MHNQSALRLSAMRIFIAVTILFYPAFSIRAQNYSSLVYPGGNGKLVYVPDSNALMYLMVFVIMVKNSNGFPSGLPEVILTREKFQIPEINVKIY